MELRNQAIVEALAAKKAADAILRETVRQAQLACTHSDLAELGGSPPVRLCLHCGMTEEGWGLGYLVLKHPGPLGVPSIGSQDYFRLRQGFCLKTDQKGPLMRRETILADLINEKASVSPA